jgi:hypothetical protein
MRQGAPLETLVDRALHQNFGNIRHSYASNRVVREPVKALAALFVHPV